MTNKPPGSSEEVSTFVRPRIDPAQLTDVVFDLYIAEGPDAGKRLGVDRSMPSRLFIGKGSACELSLTDNQVSRRHAAIDVAGYRLRISDLDSKNGTFVDGVCIIEAYLQGGETIRIGSTLIRVYRRASAEHPALPVAASFGRTLGMSTEMRRLYPLCEKLAASDVSVMIEGETGTGKEQLAESIHEIGPRRAGPFVVFDCTAVPANLLESELFGHERGAFTGAVEAKAGVFEQAEGGTLLIDEIGDLDLSLQPKLLRAIERKEVRRVGGLRTIQVDVRIIAATRRNLDREVQEGRFRDDLFHRLAVARLELPPLRRRKGDIAVLAYAFAEALGVNADAVLQPILAQWEAYPWPGNVRELRNAVARRIALGDLAPVFEEASGAVPGEATMDPDSESSALAQAIAQNLPFTEARRRVLEEFEQRYVEAVLARHGGNVTRAAAAAGIGRRYFQHVRSRNS